MSSNFRQHRLKHREVIRAKALRAELAAPGEYGLKVGDRPPTDLILFEVISVELDVLHASPSIVVLHRQARVIDQCTSQAIAQSEPLTQRLDVSRVVERRADQLVVERVARPRMPQYARRGGGELLSRDPRWPVGV